jgi:hypothetical protein
MHAIQLVYLAQLKNVCSVRFSIEQTIEKNRVFVFLFILKFILSHFHGAIGWVVVLFRTWVEDKSNSLFLHGFFRWIVRARGVEILS